MNKLANKIAIVTGGNSGIGYAAAQELSAEGATVVITGRSQTSLTAAAEALGAKAIVADQADLQSIRASALKLG